MSEYINLHNTAKLRNSVDLFLCAALYRICNDIQFDWMMGNDFANFLNLQATSKPIVVRNNEKRRVCYLINTVSRYLLDGTNAKDWITSMLKCCNISYDYYRSYYSSVGSITATNPDQSFAEKIKKAIDQVAPYMQS